MLPLQLEMLVRSCGKMVLLHKLLPRLRKESMKWVLCQIVFAFVKVACVGNWVHVCRNLINFKQ